MFKDTKALVKQIADTASEPLHTFDNTIKENPDLVIPLAVIHVVPIALMIIGTTQVILGHQKLKAEKERTKQAKLRAMMPHHGPHCGRHHGPKPPMKLMAAHHELPTE
ncbi:MULTISPECIES: hypothetical protein [unclassified Lacticaseibacillus]|uniref:hypothetical protein n=1 Tax=unclassified Lacticaseibacillus TaxID=2759744 RepID=UPI001943EA4B|nr:MULTISPECIES: hypothetical protein [unclassified Lacticaseibacillus]